MRFAISSRSSTERLGDFLKALFHVVTGCPWVVSWFLLCWVVVFVCVFVVWRTPSFLLSLTQTRELMTV